jgi:hypothetical protein
MGGSGDPYMADPGSLAQGTISQEGNSLTITVPDADKKSAELIGKIAENLVQNLREKAEKNPE